MFSGKFIKKDGKLVFAHPQDKLAYEIFLEKIPEGQKVDMYLDLIGVDHSKAQLAKVHACIRELAKESGYTFEEMKDIIKENSGLAGKSFADCSKDELMLAIEACIKLGKDNFNISL
jgi:hypothetical protein